MSEDGLILDPCPPFAQVRRWFTHGLTLDQRRQFLVVWLPVSRFAVGHMTTEMQLAALRNLHQRYCDAFAPADTLPTGGDSTEIEAPASLSGAVPEGQTPSPSPSPAAGR